jgi:hypothetical protein
MKCATCSATAIIGKTSCRKCLDNSKKRAAERYKRIKLERMCKSCPNKVLDTKGVYCASCRQKRKDTWSERKRKGLCITCGKNQKRNGLKCECCYVGCQNNIKENRRERLEKGLCAFCDNPRINNRLCLKHFLKFTSKTHLKSTKRYKELHELFVNQGGICPYTKIKLTLGKDASVDHIIPKSRGGSLEDVSNLQWVYCNVNFMKSDMLEQEFLDLVKLIAKNST